MKHQEYFNRTLNVISMEQETEGERLLTELSTALESYDKACTWLSDLESGNAQVNQELIQQFGPGMEAMSLESVQVHINSNQVQAIVDFLKKWIPIILRKIRDLAEQVIQWVQVKVRNIGNRLKNVKEKVHVAAVKDFHIPVGEGTHAQASHYFLKQENVDLLINQLDALKAMMSVCRDIADFAQDPTDKRSLSLPDMADRFSEFAVKWVGFGEKDFHEHPSLVLRLNPHLYSVKSVITLPSVMEANGKVREMIAGRGRDIGDIRFNSAEIASLSKALDKVQLQLVSSINSVSGDLRGIRSRLERIQPERLFTGGTVKPEDAEPVQIAFKMVNYAMTAVSQGLQFRLSLLGGAVDKLEAVVR